MIHLVMTITVCAIENGTFSSLIYLFKMMIFQSYICQFTRGYILYIYIYIYPVCLARLCLRTVDRSVGSWTDAPAKARAVFFPCPRTSSIIHPFAAFRCLSSRPFGKGEPTPLPWGVDLGGGGAGPSAFLCVSLLYRLPSRMHVLPSAFVTQAAFRWRPNYLSNKARGQVITLKILETGPFLLLRLLLPASEERNRKAHAANGNTAMACAWCPQTALYVHTCTVASWYHPVYPSLIPGRIAAPATRLGPIRQLIWLCNVVYRII